MDSGFATATSTDSRSWLWVASFLSLIYSVLCLAARFTGKWDLLWWDDLILGAGYMATVVHWGFLFQALSDGVGVASIALTTPELSDAARMYFGSRIPAFVAHCLAKLSILVFTRRIFAGDIYKENIFFGVSYAFTIAYGVLGVLLSSAGCRPQESLVASVDAVCDANAARWAVITAFDGITELIILAMPIWFISKNQLKASKKRIVIFVYMFRLIVIGFSIATTASYFNFLNDGNDSIDIAPVIAWQEVSLGFSLISASFPCLRSFLWAFMSRGLMTMYGNTTASASESRSHNASVQLRSMNKSHISQADGDGPRLRPERHLEYSVMVRGDAPARQKRSQLDPYTSRKRSDDSDQMIIHHETSYRVESSY
ncbi:hypothetical protein Slin15195_G012050 [Septoria linicola]|uniref:Rhodopsin domain-containing protein n=1 Tax=Septoria linicola TaxID=215465 RepID=A0A9Q9AKZ7_9PEZI|nr:hypothetical protein Slin14017_G012060 [Septoria linicola]USW47886.1 hypothetical protein Slin15195_G012050 [Septoria linicola]